MTEPIDYTVGDDGIGVQFEDEVRFYSEHTNCVRCGRKSDGVLLPKNCDAPTSVHKGVPICEDCQEVEDKMDNETDIKFVRY